MRLILSIKGDVSIDKRLPLWKFQNRRRYLTCHEYHSGLKFSGLPNWQSAGFYFANPPRHRSLRQERAGLGGRPVPGSRLSRHPAFGWIFFGGCNYPVR